MPVKREQLFFAKYLVGFVNYFVPLLLNMGIGLIIIAVRKEFHSNLWESMGYMMMIQVVYFLLFYTVAILAVILVGNLVVSFLGIMVFYGYYSVVLLLMKVFKTVFYNNYLRDNSKAYDPVSLYIRQFKLICEDMKFNTADRIIDFGVKGNLGPLFVAIALVVVVTAVAVFLFKKRPSEGAGKALVFSVSEPVIKVAILVPGVLFGGLLMYSVSSVNTVGWYIFGAVFSFVLLSMVLEMIFRLDFRGALQHKVSALVGGGIALIFSLIFILDLTGFANYLPRESRLKAISISMPNVGMEYHEDGMTYNYSGLFGFAMGDLEEATLEQVQLKGEDLSKGYKLAEHLVENYKEIKADKEEIVESYEAETKSYVYYPEYNGQITVNVCYRLKDGREVYRTYTVPYNDEFIALAEEVYQTEEYKNVVFPILEDETNYNTLVYYNKMSGMEEKKLTKEERLGLIEAYKKDVEGLTLEQTLKGTPKVLFGLDHQTMDWSSNTQYPVYDNFDNTLNYLEKLGIVVEVNWDQVKVQRIQVEFYGGETYHEHVYGNGEQAKEILNNVIEDSFANWSIYSGSSFIETNNQEEALRCSGFYGVYVEYEDLKEPEKENSFYGAFTQVPQFVQDDFAKDLK